MHLGYKIKKLRLRADLTQDQFGKKIGRTRALISYIEQTGVVNPHTLKNIANALNLDLESIEDYDDKEIKNDNIKIIESLKIQIESLKRENELLRDLVANQKTSISLLKKRK